MDLVAFNFQIVIPASCPRGRARNILNRVSVNDIIGFRRVLLRASEKVLRVGAVTANLVTLSLLVLNTENFNGGTDNTVRLLSNVNSKSIVVVENITVNTILASVITETNVEPNVVLFVTIVIASNFSERELVNGPII